MLYCGTSGRYTTIVDVGNTETYTLSGFAPDKAYECAVTAYDAARTQSDYSPLIGFYIASKGRCKRPCEGDLNNDGYVNALDLGLIKKYWGTSAPDVDLNGDGIVNVLDLRHLPIVVLLSEP